VPERRADSSKTLISPLSFGARSVPKGRRILIPEVVIGQVEALACQPGRADLAILQEEQPASLAREMDFPLRQLPAALIL